jgi:hypothetical protein
MTGEQFSIVWKGEITMATVASLFGDAREADQALSALALSPFADVETRVYEPGMDDVNATVPGAANVLGEFVLPFTDTEYDDIGEEERAWFEQGLRGGGTVVFAKVADDRAAELERFFTSHGGRTSRDA